MTQLDVWHIEGSSFHFGRRGLGQEESGLTFPSDSLFAALVARLALLMDSEELTQFCAPFAEGEPPFLLTTVYPRAGGVLFFPPPFLESEARQEDGPRPKDMKKVDFVSEGVFRKLIAGTSLAEMWEEALKYQDQSVLLLEEEREQLPRALQIQKKPLFWDIVQRTRVTIQRGSSASGIYHTGQTVFNAGCGLWFGVKWVQEEDEIQRLLRLGLNDLGIAGLGGERSSGFGVCRFSKQGALSFPEPEEGYWISLSRYLPDPDEMAGLMAARASYRLDTIGGWVANLNGPAQRRRQVTFVREGSVVGPVEAGAPGQMVDVQPVYDGQKHLGHPVWRNGYAVPVGILGLKEKKV
jgi:CRISPR-associated protein Csm4